MLLHPRSHHWSIPPLVYVPNSPTRLTLAGVALEFPADSAVFIVNAATSALLDFEVYAVSDISSRVHAGSTSEEDSSLSSDQTRSSTESPHTSGRGSLRPQRQRRPRVNSFSTKKPVEVLGTGPSYAVLSPPKAVVMTLSSEDNEWRDEGSAMILTSTFW